MKRRITDIVLITLTACLVFITVAAVFVRRLDDHSGGVHFIGQQIQDYEILPSAALASDMPTTEPKGENRPENLPAPAFHAAAFDVAPYLDAGRAAGLGSLKVIRATYTASPESIPPVSEAFTAGQIHLSQREVSDSPVSLEMIEEQAESQTGTGSPELPQIESAAPTQTVAEAPLPTATEPPQTTEPPVTEATTEATLPPTESEATEETPSTTATEQESTTSTSSPANSNLSSGINFQTPGTNGSTATNFSLVSSLLVANGASNYLSFSDNGDGTITVDGVTFPVQGGATSYTTTCYDGHACAEVLGYPDGMQVSNTATGLTPYRGMVAASAGGFPFGTVLFVEDYGLCVVADRHGMGSNYLDLAMNPYEISQGISLPTLDRRVYVIAIP